MFSRLAEQLRGWMISQEEEMKRKDKKRPRKKSKDNRATRFSSDKSVGGLATGLSGEMKGVPSVSGASYSVQVSQLMTQEK